MRIRSIKPEFYKHEELFAAEVESDLPLRLAFTGLWGCADREGRFKWRPRQLKTDILPYDEVDFSRVLHALLTRGFIVAYAGTAGNNGEVYGWIPSFLKHQIINNRESASILPDQKTCERIDPSDPRVSRASVTRLNPAQGEGKGREGKGREGEAAAPLAPSREDASAAPEPAAHVVFTFKTVGPVASWDLTEDYLAELKAAYPALDHLSEIRKANIWLISNPANAKTARGMTKFLNGWFGRAQNGGKGSFGSHTSAPRPYHDNNEGPKFPSLVKK